MGVKDWAVPPGLHKKWAITTVLALVCQILMLGKGSGASVCCGDRATGSNSHFLWTRYASNEHLSEIVNRSSISTKEEKPVLGLVDGLLSPQLAAYTRLNESQRLPSTGSCTSRDIQLQCLDARALLARTATSTPASSLDLEWEHETLPISMIHDRSDSSLTELADPLTYSPRSHLTAEPDSSIQNDTTTRAVVPSSNNSDSDWSRLSSDNSLEWDNVQNPIQGAGASPPLSEVDSDTQMLLSEIERLTRQTLSETGRELFS